MYIVHLMNIVRDGKQYRPRVEFTKNKAVATRCEPSRTT